MHLLPRAWQDCTRATQTTCQSRSLWKCSMWRAQTFLTPSWQNGTRKNRSPDALRVKPQMSEPWREHFALSNRPSERAAPVSPVFHLRSYAPHSRAMPLASIQSCGLPRARLRCLMAAQPQSHELIMIFIGTLFCNLLRDAMRLHLQPRLDMTSDTSSPPTYLHALLLFATTFTCHILTSLTWLPISFSPHFLTTRPVHIAPRASQSFFFLPVLSDTFPSVLLTPASPPLSTPSPPPYFCA